MENKTVSLAAWNLHTSYQRKVLAIVPRSSPGCQHMPSLTNLVTRHCPWDEGHWTCYHQNCQTLRQIFPLSQSLNISQGHRPRATNTVGPIWKELSFRPKRIFNESFFPWMGVIFTSFDHLLPSPTRLSLEYGFTKTRLSIIRCERTPQTVGALGYRRIGSLSLILC